MSKNLSKKAKEPQGRSDLIFPVDRIGRHLRSNLKKSGSWEIVRADAPVMTAAILENLTADLLHMAGEIAIQNKRKTITPRDLQLAMKQDEQWKLFMKRTHIFEGGVQPGIHEVLFKGKGKKGYNLRSQNSQMMDMEELDEVEELEDEEYLGDSDSKSNTGGSK